MCAEVCRCRKEDLQLTVKRHVFANFTTIGKYTVSNFWLFSEKNVSLQPRKIMLLTDIYTNSQLVDQLKSLLESGRDRIHLSGMTGSLSAVVASVMALQYPDRSQLFIAGN